MADAPAKRQTAYYCTARQLLEGSYVEREGWDPNFVATEVGAVSRVRVVGVVVDTGDSSFLVDDGSGRISARSFDSSPSVNVGDTVLVIGRPRLFDEKLYVLVEVARRLPSSKWLKYFSDHKDELQSFIPEAPSEAGGGAAEGSGPSQASGDASASSGVSEGKAPSGEPQGQEGSSEQSSSNQAETLISAIRELDPGDGAPVDEVISKAGFPEAEQKLQSLISEGEVFELRAGKVKVLE